MIKHNLFILFFLLIITVNVSAKESTIDYVYMNANMDILGSFHIREAIVTRDDELTIPIVYKPYTKKQTKDNIMVEELASSVLKALI